MAKLTLKFEQNTLREISLTQGLVTIGRLPDNMIQIDNLAVSGHHAKIYWETDRYVIEDNNSLNGTFLNNRRITKSELKDGDAVLIGKHTLAFKDEWHEGAAPSGQTQAAAAAPLPTMQATMVLDTKKAKEMLAQAQAAAKGGAAAAAPAAGGPGGSTFAAQPAPPAPTKEKVGTFTVISGKTEEPHYLLTSKLTVVGKSDMATIKLKGWFKPKVAASINKQEGRYMISASSPKSAVTVNGQRVTGQTELKDGDIIEVAGVKATFGYAE